MEEKKLKLVDTEVTKSFADALNDWRDGVESMTYNEYMTCLAFFAFEALQDIVSSTGLVVKEMKDRVLEDMHAYIQLAGDSALDALLEELREKKKEEGAAADVADAENSGEGIAAEEGSAEDAYAEELALIDSSEEGAAPDNV